MSELILDEIRVVDLSSGLRAGRGILGPSLVPHKVRPPSTSSTVPAT